MLKQWLYTWCRRYVRWVDGFSFDFGKNGEAFLLKQLGQINPETVLDIGANVGNWSQEALSALPGTRIHAFELSQSTYATLSKRFAEDSRVQVNNFGLADTQGAINYKDYGPDSTVNTILMKNILFDQSRSWQTQTATLTTGDQYCAEQSVDFIDFLKIDVEGAESRVLKGFEGMLAAAKIRMVQFEYGYLNGDAHVLMRDFYDLFDGLGYRIGLLRGSGVHFMDWTYKLNDFDSGPNFVAIRKDDDALHDLVKARMAL